MKYGELKLNTEKCIGSKKSLSLVNGSNSIEFVLSSVECEQCGNNLNIEVNGNSIIVYPCDKCHTTKLPDLISIGIDTVDA